MFYQEGEAVPGRILVALRNDSFCFAVLVFEVWFGVYAFGVGFGFLVLWCLFGCSGFQFIFGGFASSWSPLSWFLF